jgi:hypothetical protein
LTNIDQYINQTNLVPPVIDHIVIDGSQ